MPIQPKLEAALARHHAGDVAAATELYRAVLAEEPEQPDALHMMGVIAQQKGNPELALQLMEAALAKNPDLTQAWYNRCLVLRALGRPEQALESVQQALGLDAALADGWDMAGSILREMRKFDEAAACLERALQLKPDSPQILNSYAVILAAGGRLKEAYAALKKANRPDNAVLSMTLGNIIKAAGYPERAIPLFKKARTLEPQLTGAWTNEALARLQIGDLERGWAVWEKRLDDRERKVLSMPRWQGQKVGHLLLREDQGMGDSLQCLRYIPLIRDRADKITLQLTGFLQSLLISNFPDLAVITLDDPVPAADAEAQLLSLPYFCKTKLSSIPAPIPYIRAEESWRAPWRERLAALPKPRVGLVWGGNPGNRNDHNRSIAFDRMEPLLKTESRHLVSLQKGRPKDQARLKEFGVFDAEPFLPFFSDTAGLVAELDLVIAVDTAVVHLAGAMGKPVWLMVPFESDWRWLLGREDNPWYPTLRIFRQESPRDWAGVISRVVSELQAFLAGKEQVLVPKTYFGEALLKNPNAIDLEDSVSTNPAGR
ncbi:MAG: tetratricopeptide repeat protein [Alphaproteobacteria bacterium]|nr:tetratricopeptide repeat protein [Alphaproteobacteria bacterium]